MKALSSILIVSHLLRGYIAPAHAETFRNSYISFELPSGWTCSLEETEWGCSDETEGKQRSAIVEFVRREPIGDRIWIHGRQFESEVLNFYTDYFATVDDRIAILLTFSARRKFFQRVFDRFYPSMAAIRPEGR